MVFDTKFVGVGFPLVSEIQRNVVGDGGVGQACDGLVLCFSENSRPVDGFFESFIIREFSSPE